MVLRYECKSDRNLGIYMDLLYSTGNSAQYPILTKMGKELEKELDLCITKSLYCTLETNTTLQINYSPI